MAVAEKGDGEHSEPRSVAEAEMQRALQEGHQAPSMDPVKRKAKVIGSIRVESERPLAFARAAVEDALEA
eukprot:7527605-Lingulodinium_polyedra.AAC.1